MRIAALAFLAALAACATGRLPALALDEQGAPDTVSERFASQIAARYPQGGDYAAAKADVEANGFTCRDYPQYVARADIPTHECLRRSEVNNCKRQFVIELREGAGKLRSAAFGRFDGFCAVNP